MTTKDANLTLAFSTRRQYLHLQYSLEIYSMSNRYFFFLSYLSETEILLLG